MASIWLTAGIIVLAAATLALAWVALRLSNRNASANAAAELLARRVDALSLRVRQLETSRERAEASAKAKRAARNVRVDSGRNTQESGRTLIAVPSLASRGSGEIAAAAAEELSRRFGTIWNLSQAGRSIAEIASETGHPVGEIELILGLKRSTDSAHLAETSQGRAQP